VLGLWGGVWTRRVMLCRISKRRGFGIRDLGFGRAGVLRLWGGVWTCRVMLCRISNLESRIPAVNRIPTRGAACPHFPPRLPPPRVIPNDQRIAIEHRALEACVRAHVLAYLLAQEAGVAPGREGVEQHPEGFPASPVKRNQPIAELADRGEEADEGEPGPQRKQQPQTVLGGLAADLFAGPRACVETDALVPRALGPAFHPQEHFGPDRLRTGVAAPQAPGERGEEEQGQPGHDQQQGEEDEVLRPEGQAKHVELARRQVEQHRLAAVPGQPRKQVVHAEQPDHRGRAQALKPAPDLARMDLLLGAVHAAVVERAWNGLAHRGANVAADRCECAGRCRPEAAAAAGVVRRISRGPAACVD
jgi:hypothetical protein